MLGSQQPPRPEAALAQTHRTLAKLQTTVEDVNVLVVGDSTGDGVGDWVDLFAERLRAMFPTHTCRFAYWDTGAQVDYLAETVRQLGTGSTRLLTTLNTTIDNTATTVVIDNPNLLSFGGWPGAGVTPNPGSFYVLIDSEAMLVTTNPIGSTSTRSWTVTRGQLGTAAAGHNAGATVRYLPQLKIWNGSIAGAALDYVFGKFSKLVQQTVADLVFVNFGHNEGSQTDWLNVRHQTYGRLQGVCAEIQSNLPFADVVVIAQNPQTANVYQAHRKVMFRDFAARTGAGLIDVHQAFLDYGASWVSDLVGGDGVHPTAAGYQVWLNEVLRSFTTLGWGDRAVLARLQLPDWLWRGGYAYLAENWPGLAAGPTNVAPTGWTSTANTNYSKDTTAGNYDSVKGYALLIAGDGVTSIPPALTYTFSAALVTALKGKPATVLARIKTPSTWPNASNNIGRVTLTDNVSGSYTTSPMTSAKGAWAWHVVSRVMPVNMASASIKLFADSGNNKDAQVWVDRVAIVPGLLMRDAAYS